MVAKVNRHTCNTFRYCGEQDLHEDMIIESIQYAGEAVKYLPRSAVLDDYLFAEKATAAFNDSYDIEMYIDADGFGTSQDVMSKFGFEIPDEATFTVSKNDLKKKSHQIIVKYLHLEKVI